MDFDVIEYKDHKIVLTADDDPSNPREDCDNFGTMVCFHRRYKLGDDHSYSDPDELFMELAGAVPNRNHHHPVSELLGDGSAHNIVWEPLYLYDHSGITMATTPFSCPWDSGQVGIIYATYEKVRENFMLAADAPITPEIREKAEALLKAEVTTYDQYIRGDAYVMWVMDKDTASTDFDEAIDSCGNLLGREFAIEYAKEAIDGIVDKN